MISRDLLYAILQGLPEKFLEHLPPPWYLVGRLIRMAREDKADPATALRYAVYRLGPTGRAGVRKSLLAFLPVMSLTGLSYRQREALLVLRSLKTASLAQLCAILLQDRSNTFRRMAALVSKGLAIKFMQPNGVYYLAIESPLDKSERTEVLKLVDELLNDFPEENEADLKVYEDATLPLLPWADLLKKPTTPTTPTTST